jgi:CheY-like chemotaxis protein
MSHTVLVVDDDADMRVTIRDVLLDEGLVVDVAGDGQEAIERATEGRPSLVILDIRLPVMDGYQVADHLRQWQRSPAILAITGDGRAAHKARRVGAVAYLRKPFELEELVALVKNALTDGTA